METNQHQKTKSCTKSKTKSETKFCTKSETKSCTKLKTNFKSKSSLPTQVGHSTRRRQSQHVSKNVGSRTKKAKKKRSAGNKTQALKKSQARDLSFEKILERLDNLPLPSHYKIKHLGSTPSWMEPVECVNLNSIDVDPMPFIPLSDVFPWNPEDDDPFFDRCEQDEVKVL